MQYRRIPYDTVFEAKTSAGGSGILASCHFSSTSLFRTSRTARFYQSISTLLIIFRSMRIGKENTKFVHSGERQERQQHQTTWLVVSPRSTRSTARISQLCWAGSSFLHYSLPPTNISLEKNIWHFPIRCC